MQSVEAEAVASGNLDPEAWLVSDLPTAELKKTIKTVKGIGDYAAENSRQLRVYINYLRRKLEDDPAKPRLIVTEPGVGYRLQGS